jgi:hypothetical protein
MWNINKRKRSTEISLKARISGKASKRLSQEFQSPEDESLEPSIVKNGNVPSDSTINADSRISTQSQSRTINNMECEKDAPIKQISIVCTTSETPLQPIEDTPLETSNGYSVQQDRTDSLEFQTTSELHKTCSSNATENEYEHIVIDAGSGTTECSQRKNGLEELSITEGKIQNVDPISTGEEDKRNSSRPRRRAASAAAGSLKEQPIGKKLRQGDPTTSSIYSASSIKETEPIEKSDSGQTIIRKQSTGKYLSKNVRV